MRILATLFFVLGAADLVALDAFIGPAALAGRAAGAEGARSLSAASAPASEIAAETAPSPMPVQRAEPDLPPPRPLAASAAVADSVPDPVPVADPDPDDHPGARPHPVTVHFDLDSDELGDSSRASLDRVADLLEERGELTAEIDGHADESGTDDHNQELSERRARAVADYLEERGIDEARLEVRAFGERDPLSGRERSRKNRRVRIRFAAPQGDNEP